MVPCPGEPRAATWGALLGLEAAEQIALAFQAPDRQYPFDLKLKLAWGHDLLVGVGVMVGVTDIAPLSVVVAGLHLISEEVAEEQGLSAVM